MAEQGNPKKKNKKTLGSVVKNYARFGNLKHTFLF